MKFNCTKFVQRSDRKDHIPTRIQTHESYRIIGLCIRKGKRKKRRENAKKYEKIGHELVLSVSDIDESERAYFYRAWLL